MSLKVPSSPTSPSALEIKDEVCANAHRLIMSGELDMASAASLESAIAAICSHVTTSITLDLDQVSFVDSSGLRALLRAQELCRERGYAFRLLAPQRQALRLFALTGVQLPVVPRAEALA